MIKVDLVVSSSQQVDSVQIDRLTHRLAADLRREAQIVVEVDPGPARPGSKSGAALEVGRLILAGIFSAATAQAIASVLRSYYRQRKETVFELTRGDLKVVVRGTKSEVEGALARLPALLEKTGPDK